MLNDGPRTSSWVYFLPTAAGTPPASSLPPASTKCHSPGLSGWAFTSSSRKFSRWLTNPSAFAYRAVTTTVVSGLVRNQAAYRPSASALAQPLNRVWGKVVK